jgi:hypothetical protein
MAILLGTLAVKLTAQPPRLVLAPHDRVVLVGNTLAERMQLFNHFETLLAARFPELQLTVRNLGWSGDTVALQPRPLNFGTTPTHLYRQKADVILAFFGLNESFGGEAGLEAFEHDLDAWMRANLSAHYNGASAPRIVLVSPIAHEALPRLPRIDTAARNRELALTEHGDRVVARLLLDAIAPGEGLRDADAAGVERLEALREAIRDKNEQFFYRFRPVNGEYVVGRRVEPFGSVNFPGEMKQLDEMVAERDRRIWTRAKDVRGLAWPVTGVLGGSARASR